MTEVTAVEVISTSTRRPSNGETLISLVLDETGSMSSCYDATISSVNEFIGSQKAAPGIAKVNLTTFSSVGDMFMMASVRSFDMNKAMNDARETGENVRPVFTNLPIEEVGDLTKENYRPNGMTNLYDAIGVSIRRVEDQLAGLEEIPNVLLVIITDGGENSSREYNLPAIQSMIKAKEAEGWTFVYLGANQDAWSVAQTFGLAQGQAMTYSTDNMSGTMATLSAATTVYRGARLKKGFASEETVSRNFFGPEA